MSNLYHSIHNLTLERFIRCLCDNDLNALVIDENIHVPEHQLHVAWDKIYDEYLDAFKDREQEYVTKLSKEINLLQTQYNLVQLIVARLAVKHNDEILQELKKILFVPAQFDPADPEKYNKDLQLVLSTAKTWLIRLQEKKAEYHKLLPTNTDSVKADRAHFDSLIVSVSQFMKYHVDRRKVMVGEFLAMMLHMRAMHDELKKVHEKQKNNGRTGTHR